MTLTLHNQLKLLHDLLDEQLTDRTGDCTEFAQIKRLVQSIMSNNTIRNTELIEYLPEIYYYGIKGENIQCDHEHITTNQDQIKQWKLAIINTTVASR